MNARSTSAGSLAAISVAILALAGCGGSSDDSGGGGGGGVTPSTTTDVTIKAIDGVLRNALVCMDKNLNGR